MAEYCHAGKVRMADYVRVERIRWRTLSGWRGQDS